MRVSDEIEKRLRSAFPIARLEVIDDSQRHRGHAGARPEGESHFRLKVVTAAFVGKSRLERQRMIYAALGDLMQTDVHALQITAHAPEDVDPQPD
jgi:BolA protein